MLYRSSVRRRHFYARTTRLTSAAPGIVCRTRRSAIIAFEFQTMDTSPARLTATRPDAMASTRRDRYARRSVHGTAEVFTTTRRGRRLLCVFITWSSICTTVGWESRAETTVGTPRPSARHAGEGPGFRFFEVGGGQTK